MDPIRKPKEKIDRNDETTARVKKSLARTKNAATNAMMEERNIITAVILVRPEEYFFDSKVVRGASTVSEGEPLSMGTSRTLGVPLEIHMVPVVVL